MSITRIKEKFGSVLAVVLIILLVMTLVIFAIATMSSRHMNNVVGEYWEDRARFGAISGVHRCLTELANDPTFAGAMADMPLDGDPDVTWSVTVENNVSNATGVYASDNRTWVPPGAAYIHSIGKMRSLATSGVTSVAAIISPQRPVFNDALFGTVSVEMDKSQTVSWYPGTFGKELAHVATNAIVDNVIKIVGGSKVDGDAVSGVDPVGTGNPVFVDGGSTVVGSIRKADETKVTSAFVSPVSGPVTPTITGGPLAAPQVLTPGAYGPIELNGTAVTLNGGGSYYFQNYFDMRNNAELNIVATLDNPVRIYFNSSCVIWNGCKVNWNKGTNTPNAPRLCQIYKAQDGTASEMHISEVDSVAFVSAGENMDVYITDAILHGSIIGKIIKAKASVIRYDTRLKGVPLDGTGGFEILSMVVENKNEPPAAAPPPAPPPVAVNPPPPAAGPAPAAPPPPSSPPPPPGPAY
jgi:hypothetical protein